MTQPGQKRNYQKELDRLIEGLQREGRIPKLLLHSCCAPCSSYVLEYLSQYFDVTVYYYNPNIFPEAEYEARVKEQERLIREMAAARPVRFLAGSYEPEEFFSIARGHEKDPEGGERCHRCYELRLDRAAREAASGNFDFFTTTLSISPLKNADWPASMESLIWFRILRRKTAISVLWNYPHCTDFTVRITAAVSIHGLKRKKRGFGNNAGAFF